jgi:hypothetical protein
MTEMFAYLASIIQNKSNNKAQLQEIIANSQAKINESDSTIKKICADHYAEFLQTIETAN